MHSVFILLLNSSNQYPRLLTFSQTKYPPEDISQLMG